jgi:hypothetical protein
MTRVLGLSNRNYQKEKENISVFVWTIREFYGLKVDWSFQKIKNSGSKFLMNHISPNFLFIRVAPKCTKIFDEISSGPE